MAESLKRNKWLICSVTVQLLLFVVYKQKDAFETCLYDLSFNFANLVFGMGVVIMDILFVYETALCFYHINDQIVLRIGKKEYIRRVLVSIFIATCLLVISKNILSYLFFHQLSLKSLKYSLILSLSTSLIFLFDSEKIHHYLILLSLLVITILKVL